MVKRLLWMTVIVLALALVGGGVVYAQTSEHFDLSKRSMVGASLGGKVMSSDSFRVVTSMGVLVDTSVSSENFQLCSGYICDAGSPVPQLYLPTLRKAE